MDDFDIYFNKAVRFLSYRPRSEKEIRDYLKKKETPTDILEKIILFFKEKKFLNDEEFARMWVRQRTNIKPKSKWVIKMELLQKGIDPEIADRVLASGEEGKEVSDLEQAKKLVRNKLPRYTGLSRQELYQKLGGFLARRGFSWDIIKESIDSELNQIV